MLLKWNLSLPMFAADEGGGGGAPASDAGSPAPGSDGTGGDGGAPQGGSSSPSEGQTGASTSEGGEKNYTQSQVEGMIKARIAEAKASAEKQLGEMGKYKGLAEKIAAMTGNTLDSIEEQLAQIEAEAVSKQTGIPAPVYQEMVKTQDRMTKLEKENLEARLDLEETKLMTNPTYSSLKNDDVRKEVRDLATKSGLTVEQAFWASQGSKGTAQMERDIEQRVLASIQNKAGKGNILSDGGGSPADPTYGLSADEIAFYESQGDNLEEMAALKAGNSIDQYRKFKKSKSK